MRETSRIHLANYSENDQEKLKDWIRQHRSAEMDQALTEHDVPALNRLTRVAYLNTLGAHIRGTDAPA